MSIESICKSRVVTIDESTTLKEVSDVMLKEHVGCVVVTKGANGKRIPAGVITDRDVALSLGSSEKPQNIKVVQIMKSHPITAKTSEGIFETAVKMRENGVKRLPVVNPDGSLFGIISSDDLLSLMIEEINNLAMIGENQMKKEKGLRMPTEWHSAKENQMKM